MTESRPKGKIKCPKCKGKGKGYSSVVKCNFCDYNGEVEGEDMTDAELLEYMWSFLCNKFPDARPTRGGYGY